MLQLLSQGQFYNTKSQGLAENKPMSEAGAAAPSAPYHKGTASPSFPGLRGTGTSQYIVICFD